MNTIKAICAGVLGLALHSNAQVCNDPQGVYALYASYAVLTGMELGRWQPLTDFEIQDGKLKISAAGQARCASFGHNCPTLGAMLGMQDDRISDFIDQSIFSPVIFRQRLVIQFQRQQIAAMRPETDPNRAWAAPHYSDYLYSEMMGNDCGIHLVYEINNETSVPTTPEQICSQLIFVGSQGMVSNGVCIADNPFIDARVIPTANGFNYAIDPKDDLVNMTSEPVDMSKTYGCAYVDPTQTAAGASCQCNGASGVLQPMGSLQSLYSCR